VLHAIERCRTAALGGHLERCDQCGQARNAYNSCADLARRTWAAAANCWRCPRPSHNRSATTGNGGSSSAGMIRYSVQNANVAR
jgi:hypothetical protein